MSRPKGSGDKCKRKRKVLLNGNQERQLIKDYENGYTASQIKKKYSITQSTISALKKQRGIKSRLNHKDVVQWQGVYDFKSVKNISGIYGIYFTWNYDKEDPDRHHKINDIKAYIGSSIHIGKRLITHDNDLRNNKHFNKNLQDRYNDAEFSVKYAIIEECTEDEIMQKEGWYLDRWDMGCLFNTWKAIIKKENIRPWLEKAITADAYAKNYTISKTNFYNGTACKETNNVHKSGYGRMQTTVEGVTKYLAKHRVAYWHEYGEYVELVRHMCDNPKCFNPQHLAKGNHKDNMLDRRGDFAEEFEKIWLQYQGDLYDISKYYEEQGRWKPNQDWFGKKVSYSVYEWERKLDLRKKYPDIAKNRFSMLRSEQAMMVAHEKRRNKAANTKV